MWRVTVSDGSHADGRQRRRSVTVHGCRDDAEHALAGFQRTRRNDLGDLLVRELVDRYLDDEHARGSAALARERRVLHELIDPDLGPLLAARLCPADVEHAARKVYVSLGAGPARRVLGILRDAYRWAQRKGWCDTNPIQDITVRTLR